MANPAHILHEQFKKWSGAIERTSAKQAVPHRVRRQMNEPLSLAEHRTAMACLYQLPVLLDELEAAGLNVDTFRNSMSGWTKAVLCFPDGWGGTQANASIFTPQLMDNLQNLVTLINARAPGFNRLDTAPLLDGLASVEEELRGDESLPDELRQYIHLLVREARAAISDFEVLGTVDIFTSMQRLRVALFAAADQTEGEAQKGRWREKAQRFAYESVVGASGGILASPVVYQVTQYLSQ